MTTLSTHRIGSLADIVLIALMGWELAGCERQAAPPSITMTSSGQENRTNHLLHEKSPYLKQHVSNPVDWYPWNEEALAKAKREDKPIFLSIGYSTCHWCHVMERESFEDPEIARLINQWFVPIKVDREEHPDLDQLYLQAVLLMSGQGGWPLTVFLTPDRKPFFGGTYFPPERRWDRPGLRELLPSVAEAWRMKRQQLATSAEQITASLQEGMARSEPSPGVTVSVLQQAFNQAAAAYDPSFGGFGDAPKFPRADVLSFLLAFWQRTGTSQALEMVTGTLDHLARGGIHDQLGGGFHRYATDAQWLVPHFEKMLYDQALLGRAYVDAYRATHRPDYAEVARGIFDYVLRDLHDPQGGFYAAEDADSEGEEGKFYVWTPHAIVQTLGSEDGELFNRFYGVASDGNFEHGTSILHIEQPLDEFAKLKQLDPKQLAERLVESRKRLLAARGARIRPHRDEKILTSWNGLMIAALARGGAALDEPRYLHAAIQAAEFILAHLWKDGRLLRRVAEGEAAYAGTLEDYAFFSDGLFELYEATFDTRWLSSAKQIASQMIERFRDEAGGGFFLRDQADEPLIVRVKEFSDGATPSGNSLAALVLLRLGRLTADDRMESYGRRTLEAAAGLVERAPFGYPQLLQAADLVVGPAQEIVIAGDPAAAGTQAMLRILRARLLPRAVIALHASGRSGEALEALIPFAKAQTPLHGQPTAYVCERFTCKLPVTEPDALRRLLEETKRDP